MSVPPSDKPADTLAALRDRLTPEQLARVRQRLRGDAVAATPPPTTQDPRSEQPLAFAQERLWYLERSLDGPSRYIMAWAFDVAGPLDTGALRTAATAVITYHPTLRTGVAERDGVPLGMLREEVNVTVDVEHIDVGADVDRLVHAAARRPFDLAGGELLRLRVFSATDVRHTLLLTVHHLVADAWSMDVILADLAVGYAAALQGEVVELARPATTYADFADHQREMLDGNDLRGQLDFWADELRDAPPVLDLATTWPRPGVQRGHGIQLRRPVPADLVTACAGLARSEGATSFMVLLAALAVVLSRHSGQEDLVVGLPVAGRTRPELERVVGLFVNTLPIRVDLRDAPTFRRLVQRVRDGVVRGLGHQDVPFEHIVRRTRPPRTRDRAPLVQVLADLQRPATLTLSGADVTPRHVDGGTAKVDQQWSFVDGGGGDASLDVILGYDTDLFDAAAAERMVAHYGHLLAGALEAPDRSVRDIPMLTAAERQWFTALDATSRELGEWTDLVGLVDRWADAAPHRAAVVFADEVTDYATLRERGRELTSWLRANGVGPETVVGVSARRSTEMVIALLAVLRAGAAFLPLDPDDPPARCAAMVAEAGVTLILTPPDSAGRLDGLGPSVHPIGKTTAVPSRWAPDEDAPTGDARNAVGSNLAYVIYTSGSSGKPKGVMVSGTALANRIAWVAAAHPLGPDDVVLHKTPLTFDVSLGELFWPLTSGARLVLLEPVAHRDPDAIIETIARERVTAAHFVPSMLRPFLDRLAMHAQHRDSPTRRRAGGLRRLFCSGEALTSDLVAQVGTVLPGVALHNLYGPTEAAIEVSSWHCGPADVRTVPIGHAAANCRLYVLDAHLRRVPIGVPGDLYLAGVQLARGYVGRPDLTARAFLPDPFSAQPGARMYRTGDRALIRPDGAIEYLGRLDRQTKVRGFRIELAEIEAALQQCRGVAQAAVTVHDHELDDGRSDRRIHAYLVAEEASEAPTAADIREQVRGLLPAYMVPATVTWCAGLQSTPSGKLDYAALPRPHNDDRPTGPAGAGPVEHRIAAVIADVLGASDVSTSADFFDLGGHSLLALSMLGRLARDLGVQVPLRTFLADPTAQGLAAAHRQSQTGQQTGQRTGRTISAAGDDGLPILVTGATGTIGSFVVPELLRQGYRLRVLRRPGATNVGAAEASTEIVTGDLDDPAGLRRAASGTAGVIHLAWQFHNGYGDDRTTPDDDRAILGENRNIEATDALADAWASGGAGGAFVFVSTVDVYGRPAELPVTEEHPLDPGHSAYGRAKIRCEELVREHAARHGREDFTILRPPYVWGPHPYCRWQLRAAAGHRFFEAVRAGTPLLLPGATSAASDAFGHAWVDAREIATAIVECLRRPSGTPLNIVNEHFSWSAFYTVLAELTGQRPTVGFGAPTDDFHHLRRQYSTVRARQHLGFQPVHDWRATLTELIDAAPTVPTQRPPASTN